MESKKRHITELSRILGYVQRKMSFSDRYELEKESQTDLFLNDALDGFDNIEGEELLKDLAAIQLRLGSVAKKEKSKIWYLKIVASITLFIGIGVLSYFIINKSIVNNQVAYTVQKELGKDDLEEGILATLPKSKIDVAHEEKGLLVEKGEVVAEPAVVEYKDISVGKEVLFDEFDTEDIVLEMADEELVELDEIELESVEYERSLSEVSQPLNEAPVNKLKDAYQRESTPIVVQEQTSGIIAEDVNQDKSLIESKGFKNQNRLSIAENISYSTDIAIVIKVVVINSTNIFEPNIGNERFEEYVNREINKSIFKDEFINISFELDAYGIPINFEVDDNISEEQVNEIIKVFEKGSAWKLKEGVKLKKDTRISIELKFRKE